MEHTLLCVLLLLNTHINSGHSENDDGVVKAVLTINSNSSQIFSGESVTLRCDIQGGGVTDWKYRWLTPSPDQCPQKEHECIISAAEFSYSCLVSHQQQDSKWSDAVRLTVTPLPKATLTVEPNPVFPGETVTLTCVIPGYTDWRYFWFRDNQHLPSQTSKAIDITIPITLTGQTGQYRCEGLRTDRPQMSQPSDDITISVTALPKATLTVEPNPVYLGETVTLMCSVGSDSIWSYQWYKDRNDNVVSQSVRHTITGDTLTISGSTVNEGPYWCQGKRESRPTSSSISDPVTITVNALPRASVSVSPQGLLYSGETVSLQCDISDYTDWTYLWFRDNQHLPSQTSKAIDITIPITLTGQAGQYRCEGLRTDRPQRSLPSDDITLSVTALPKATLTVKPNPVFPGETVTLMCSVGSDSIWNYQWYKDRNYYYVVSQSVRHTITGDTLTISRAGVSDQGRHWCVGNRVSRHTSSQPSDPVTLTVIALPTASVKIVTPQGLLYPGETVTLQCDISDYTDWTYRWFRYSEELPIQSRKTIISLPDQAGLYQCVGRRRGRPQKSDHSFSLPIIITALPKTTLTVKPNPAYTGETVTLTCSVGSYSIWSYKWYKDRNDNVVSQSGYSNIGVSHTISRAAESDQGRYWCEGSRVSRPTSSQPSDPVTLTVKALPTASVKIVTPQGLLYPGETVTLQCDISDYTGWTYRWFRYSEELPIQSRKTIIISLPDQAGQYQCVGRRRGRPQKSDHSFFLPIIITALPKTTLTVKPNPAYTGETVTLMCSVGSDSIWSYKWYKDRNDNVVSQSGYSNIRVSHTISRAAKSDQGRYWCEGSRASRPTSSQPSNAITLTVKDYQPKTTLTSDKENVFTGDSVTLSCTVESSGWKFYWYRHRPDSTPVTTTSGYSYTLSWVNVSDGGQYWCRAGRGDPVYYTLYSDPVQINMTDGYVILESPVHPVTEGDSVTLTCTFRYQETNPKLKTDFYKDGVLIKNETTGEMTIPTVSKSDEGFYKCKSDEGESPESWVTVRVPPGSVVSISLTRLLCGLLVMSPFLLVSIMLTMKCCRARGLCSTVKSPLDQIPCDDVIEQDESSV